MVAAVDSSVLLDVLLNDPRHASVSISALRAAAHDGSLIIGEVVLVEIIPTLPASDIPTFLAEWNLTFVPSSQASTILAGQIFRAYLSRGGKPRRIVADFLIAAHAQTNAQRLLARDRGFFRDYFRNLMVWYPTIGT